MALIPSSRYPGQVDADAAYPQGKARNVTVSGDGTGTPWEKDLVNDIFGLLQSLLSDGSVTPSGTPDAVGASDYLTAIKSLVLGAQATYALAPGHSDVVTSPHASFMRVSAASTGYLVGGISATLRNLRAVANVGSTNAWSFVHEDTLITAARRILCPDSVDMVMRPGDVALLAYDVTSSRWRVLGKRIKSSELASDSDFLSGAYSWLGVHDWSWSGGSVTLQIGSGDVVLTGAGYRATGTSSHFQAQNAGSNPAFIFTGTLPQRAVTFLPPGDAYSSRAPTSLNYGSVPNGHIAGYALPVPRSASIRGLRASVFQLNAGSSDDMTLELVRVTRNKTGSGPTAAPVVIGSASELATFNTENVILDVGAVNYQISDPDINLEARITLADNASTNTQRLYWLEVTFDDPGPRNF